MITSPTALPPTSLGGYRLVRTLGAGPRATVYLGHAEGHPQVALKVFAASVDGDRIELEAEALMRAAGAHVVRLVDLALDPGGRPALVLERIAGPSLGALLDRRRTLRPGEAVTILAPLAATVARLHRDGVVHGGLDPASVLFTEAGSPTLAGFGDARLLDLHATGRALVAERTDLLARDDAALHRLALTVLEATPEADPRTARVIRELTRGAGAGYADYDGPRYAALLENEAFDLADPEPLDLDAPPRSMLAFPGRPTDAAGRPSATPAQPRGMMLDGLQVPDWLRGMLGARSAAVLARVRSGAGAVRRPFWVAGGVAVALFTGAMLLVPTDEPKPQVAPSDRPAPATVPTATPSATEGVLLGDDPAAAATALLEVRAECFRELSVLCLDTVDQQDSSAAVADTAAILAAQESGGIGAEGVIVAGEAETVERMGDTALVRITPPDAEPASVLVIRTEAGWRIRGFPGAAGAAAEGGLSG